MREAMGNSWNRIRSAFYQRVGRCSMTYSPIQEPQVMCWTRVKVGLARAIESSMMFLGTLCNRTEKNWFPQSSGHWLKVWFLGLLSGIGWAPSPPLAAEEPAVPRSLGAGPRVSQAWDALQKWTPVRSGFPVTSTQPPERSQGTSWVPLFSQRLLPFPTL